jgi:hypothetical protein
LAKVPGVDGGGMNHPKPFAKETDTYSASLLVVSA